MVDTLPIWINISKVYDPPKPIYANVCLHLDIHMLVLY